MIRRVRLIVVMAALCVWPASMLAEDAVKITPDIVYGHKDGMALTFDVFRPASNANGAGVLFMVSGGWISTWTPPERAVSGYQGLLDKGFTVFSVRHGSSPRYKVPDAVADVRLAVRYIRLHAKELGIDAERLGVYGGSAGGHLSLMLGTASDKGDPNTRDEVARTSDRVAAVVAYFPPVDIRELGGPAAIAAFPALDFDRSLAGSISPILFVTPDDPPTLLIHGDSDLLVNISNSRRIYAEFKNKGVDAEFVTMPGAGHGFRGADAEKAGVLTVDWFVKYLVKKE